MGREWEGVKIEKISGSLNEETGDFPELFYQGSF
jgi:hypothetical protein